MSAEPPKEGLPPKAPPKPAAKAPAKTAAKAPEAGPAKEPAPPVLPAEPKIPPKKSLVAERLQASSPIRDDPTKAFTMATDPRTGLGFVDIPSNRQKAFSDLGKDVLLHIFMDCDKISSKDKPLRRVLFITDQTVFLCEDSGGVARCFQVSQIEKIVTAPDASNYLGVKVPSEYDMILRFDKPEQRQDVINVLKAVYLRMAGKELLEESKAVKVSDFKMSKPAKFAVTIIPQRTKAHLRKAMENMEKGEYEKLKMVELVQGELENEHKQQVSAVQKEVDNVLGKLDEMNRKMKETQDAFSKQSIELEKYRKRVQEIDGQFGPNGEAPPNKDDKLREMQRMIDTLNQQLQNEQQQRLRLQQLQQLGNFAEVDPANRPPEVPGAAPPQGGTGNIVQLLQDQLAARTRELHELDMRQREIVSLQDDLRRGDAGSVPRSLRRDRPAGEGSPVPGPGVMTPQGGLQGANQPQPMGGGMGQGGGLPFGMGSNQLFDEYEKQMGIIPMNESEMKVDPFNRLYLSDVPPQMTAQFSELNGCIMYMFAQVQSMTGKKGVPQKRVVVITDQTMFVCGLEGTILRCIDLRSIYEVVYDDNGNVAFRVNGKGEYDVFHRMESPAMALDLIHILGTIQQQHNVQPRLVVTQVPPGRTVNPMDYQLDKPADWVFQLHHVRPKSALYQKYMEEKRRRETDRRNVELAAEHYANNVLGALREEVRGELVSAVENEIVTMQSKTQELEKALMQRTEEVSMLRHELARHKCFDPAGKPGNRNDVTAWVPSDPLVVDCGLPILHMQLFEDKILFTSHSNGFINVWNAVTGTLMRTFRDHTARVTCFQFNGVDLFSGSHDSTVRRWNVETGQCTAVLQPPHKGHVTALKFNTVMLVTGSSDCTLKVWNLVTLRCDKILRGHKNTVSAIAFEDKFLVSAEWGWVFVWDMEFGVVVKALRDEMGGINSLAVHDTRIVVGGNGADVHIWEVRSGEMVPLEGHTDDVICVDVVDNLIVTCSTDCTVRMWKLEDLKPLGIFHNSFPVELKGFYLSKTHFAVAESKLVKIFTR